MEFREVRDLIISAVVLAFAFGLVFSDGILNFAALPRNFAIALFAISLGFLLHELAHRHVARKNNMYAEYRMWPAGLVLAVAFALIGGFVFAAPGAVYIQPRYDLWGRATQLTRKGAAMISIAGPAMNTILGLGFIAANFVFPMDVFYLGAWVNIWLALFNMIPFGPLDGTKILRWDKRIWALFFAVLIALMVFLAMV